MRRQGRAPPWVAVHGIYCITVLRRWGDSGERVLYGLARRPCARWQSVLTRRRRWQCNRGDDSGTGGLPGQGRTRAQPFGGGTWR